MTAASFAIFHIMLLLKNCVKNPADLIKKGETVWERTDKQTDEGALSHSRLPPAIDNFLLPLPLPLLLLLLPSSLLFLFYQFFFLFEKVNKKLQKKDMGNVPFWGGDLVPGTGDPQRPFVK